MWFILALSSCGACIVIHQVDEARRAKVAETCLNVQRVTRDAPYECRNIEELIPWIDKVGQGDIDTLKTHLNIDWFSTDQILFKHVVLHSGLDKTYDDTSQIPSAVDYRTVAYVLAGLQLSDLMSGRQEVVEYTDDSEYEGEGRILREMPLSSESWRKGLEEFKFQNETVPLLFNIDQTVLQPTIPSATQRFDPSIVSVNTYVDLEPNTTLHFVVNQGSKQSLGIKKGILSVEHEGWYGEMYIVTSSTLIIYDSESQLAFVQHIDTDR